ncbi:MAG: hypothetical protein QXF13_05035 [Thermoproteota archaeon]
MDVKEVLRKIGGDQLVDAVRAALSGSEDVVETALDEGIELKFAEGAVPEAQVAEPEPAPEAQPQDDTEQETAEKSARTFARQIEELANDAGERDAELLRALAVVVRRADPEQFGALAAILRKVRGKAIQENADRIAAKMEQESGIGYAYPEPESEEKSQSDAAVAELRAQIDELRRALDELRQKSAAVSPAAVSLTRQPAPAAHLLYRSLVRNS